ncbi:MAG: hypothetical protein NT060_04620 [Candidatus Omnitrophica bacterium]|nr:hypothetical protein [Candidatus Omnitrophota bacterium]
MTANKNTRGQALLELAIFGSLILVIFGLLLSYLNRANDLQYLQMRTFREALQIANRGAVTTSPSVEGGGSVQLTLVENRRNPDVTAYFRKGSPQATNANASVLWSVPDPTKSGESMAYYKVNDDYADVKNKGVQGVVTSQYAQFTETMNKREDVSGITNIRSSNLKDSIITDLVDKDGNVVDEFIQGLYLDPDTHQYRYSEEAFTGDAEVVRSRTWTTPGH